MSKINEKSLNVVIRMSKRVGALKVINDIQGQYRTSLGEIYINPTEWTKFKKSYNGIPVNQGVKS